MAYVNVYNQADICEESGIYIPIFINLMLYISFLFATDVVGSKVIGRMCEYTDSTRWFYLHVVTNTCTTYISFHDMILTLDHPNGRLYFDRCSHSVGVNITLALHIYHYIAFKCLRRDDHIHHISMIGTMIISCAFQGGSITNYLLFYLNGLPGLLDYSCLLLVKMEKMESITQKAISVYINTWIRAPGILYGCVIIWIYYRIGYLDYIHPFFLLFNLMMSYWNGLYYNMRVTYNYGMKNVRITQKRS
jgi:hypothetical protein